VKGKGWRREGGKVTEGIGWTGHGMRRGMEGKEEGEGKGGEEELHYSPQNFNSWYQHCLLG